MANAPPADTAGGASLVPAPSLFDARSLRSLGHTRLDLGRDLDLSSGDDAPAALSSLFSYSRASFSSRDGVDAPADHISPHADPRGANGYHGYAPPGTLSGPYNAHRRGLVFSDGGWDPDDDRVGTCRLAGRVLHAACRAVLDAIGAELGAGDLSGRFGGEGMECAGQWHVKEFRPLPDDGSGSGDGGSVWMDAHTDPSLVSVVVHSLEDVPAGSPSGLQVRSRGAGWTDVPYGGHGVATVMVGSLFGVLMPHGGTDYPPCRHRVAGAGAAATAGRIAATYFLRPVPHARLHPIIAPAPHSLDPGAKNPPRKKPPSTYGEWCDRVSKNYSRRAAKNPKKKLQPAEVAPRLVTAPAAAACSLLYPSDGPLVGKEQYLGGEVGADGQIYCIPGHAAQVMAIYPSATSAGDRAVRIGPKFTGQYKWLRSVQTGGRIYGLPCHADAVLVIDPADGDAPVSLLGEGGDWCDIGKGTAGPAKSVEWKYHGGCVSPHDGCIYCVPQSAERVLKIDPVAGTAEAVGPRFPGRLKWYGGLLGDDGAIYGVPHNAAGVLRIDPSAEESVTVHGDYGQGGHKWHGGIRSPHDGAILGIPANRDTVLRIVPGDPPSMEHWGDASVLRTGQHRSDGKYKFLGAMPGRRGEVYLIPSDADRAVVVRPDGMVAEVGPCLVGWEPARHNKWQNGVVGRDGALYGIPLKGETVLRIVPPAAEGEEAEVTTVGGYYRGLNKWEGAVMGTNGVIYCMPLNYKAILRIEPAKSS